MRLLPKQSLVRWHMTPCADYHSRAVDGFALLGLAGEPAVPALMRLLADEAAEIRRCAAACLDSVGPAATRQ